MMGETVASISDLGNESDLLELVSRTGARLREPLSTFVSGDRYASLVDPFGVRWSVMTRVEDLSPEESASRVARWAEEHAKAG